MAVIDGILQFSDEPSLKIAALGTSTSSSEQNVGQNKIIVINATQDICIKRGATGMGAAAATDYRIPAGQQTMMATGQNGFIRVFNLSASTAADVYIAFLAVN